MHISVRNTDVYVRDMGHGVPTLFLHGNPDSGDLWDPVVSQVQNGLRCIVPDLPGYGRSTAPDDFDVSLTGLAAWVDDLVTALQLETPINLVVHDFGGPYGLTWAALHPEKVRKLVISNTVYAADYRWHPGAQLWRTPIIGELVMRFTPRKVFADALRSAAPKLSDAYIDHLCDGFHPAAKRMALRLYRATEPVHYGAYTEKLAAVTAAKPTLVIWGDRDPFAAAAYADRFGAQEVMHLDVGHWVPREAADAYAEAIARFLA